MLGVPLDGPMPEHAPGMGWHYDLHVWFWEDNPAGLFVPFNTAVPAPNESVRLSPGASGAHRSSTKASRGLRAGTAPRLGTR